MNIKNEIYEFIKKEQMRELGIYEEGEIVDESDLIEFGDDK